MITYRVRRPKQYEELINLLIQGEGGVFDSYKSVLLFTAALGFKKEIRVPFTDTSERVMFSFFGKTFEQPFVYCMAITEFDDVKYLKEENYENAFKAFEEYAAGGLQYLDGVLDKSSIKESIERILSERDDNVSISDIASEW